MMKKILTTLFLIISIASIIHADDESISIECTIGKVSYVYFNQLQSCTVKTNPNILKRDIKVTSVCGTSTSGTGVRVFYALSKVIRYIPKNLIEIFPNITGFRLESTQLKMVTKDDLAPFLELTMFASVSNHIEFLEEDLFINNKNLEYVSFRANKISYIHPSVFSVISGSLQQLYMASNALNCAIASPITKTAIKNSLEKFATSPCVDILNAPALYILWLELKAQNEGGSEELGTCTSDLQAVNSELTTAKTDLGVAQGSLAKCSSDLEGANGNLETCNTDLASKAAEYDELNGTVGQITTNLDGCCNDEAGKDLYCS